MSDQRRPSPVQPPLTSGPRLSMATAERPTALPPPSFLGRPEPRATLGPSLPAIHTLQTHQRESHVLPPIRLPPLQTAVPESSAPRHQIGGHPISIQQLLTQSSPPPARPAAYNGAGYVQAAPTPLGLPLHHPSFAPTSVRHSVPEGPRAPDMIFTEARSASTPRAYASFSHVSFSGAGDRPPAAAAASQSPSRSSLSPRSSLGPALPSRHAQPSPYRYELTMRQQPAVARACGFGERDRRVIDPPPILELRTTDTRTGAPAKDHEGMLALRCTLMTEDGTQDDSATPHPAAAGEAGPAHNALATRRLMGSLVASPYEAKDERGVAGTFFVFPDLSCRAPGRYRLQFQLLRIVSSLMQTGMKFPTVAGFLSEVFAVYTAKDFPGMRASSALLKALRRQGLNVGVKKGSEARKGKGKGKGRGKKEDSSSGEEEEEGTTTTTTAVVVAAVVVAGASRTTRRRGGGSSSGRARRKQKAKRRRRDS
ncbi:hypothetical protein LTR53_006211 [Teratosphaeriaceae sp. CCFEE 6253]|nr:hypothetical protein LTR53_006211 [Teratosphaeriaceae sp. CCFEE 6253]